MKRTSTSLFAGCIRDNAKTNPHFDDGNKNAPMTLSNGALTHVDGNIGAT